MNIPMVKTELTETDGYNARGEVVSATIGTNAATYAYDHIGNRLTSVDTHGARTYAANALNEYDLAGTDVPDYDEDGNPILSGGRQYAWDAENRLVSVGPADPQARDLRSEFSYDWQSRRVGKTSWIRTGNTWQLIETRDFVYDDWNLIREIRSDSATGSSTEIDYFWGGDLSNTLQGAGGGVGLLAVSIGGNFYFPGYDNNGNVVGYWDESGSLVAEYVYDTFGNTISSSGLMASVFPHRFSTKYYDAETDLYYYGYRYYASLLGRWISRDPIEEEGGINLYQATANDMISQVDFLGNRISMISATKENTVSITLSITMQIVFPCSGPALQEKAKAIRDRIKERWTQSATKWGKTFKIGFSKFSAVAVVHENKSAWRTDYHTFNLVNKDNGFNQDTKLWEVSHVEQVGGSYCEVFKNHHDNFETYVHEFGHMLGLSDLYITRERSDFLFHGDENESRFSISRVPSSFCGFRGRNKFLDLS